MLYKKYSRRDEKMDTEQDNKKVNFPINKLTIAVAALGISGGVFFGAFLSQQNNEVATVAVQQEIIIETSKPAAESETPAIENNSESAIVFSDSTLAEHVDSTSVSTNDLVSSVIVSESTSQPKAEQVVSNESSKGTVSTKPRETSSNSNDPVGNKFSDIISGEPNAGTGNEVSTYCPINRESDPALYDACTAGFVAPTVEWAGFHSCRKIEDPTRGTFVEIVGKVQLVGGNYGSYEWGTKTSGNYGLVVSTMQTKPYVVMWRAFAHFDSLNPAYGGSIAKISGSGTNFIEESSLPSECRL